MLLKRVWRQLSNWKVSFARIVPHFLLEAWIVDGVLDNRGRPRFRSTAELVDNNVCLATEGFVGNVSPRTVSSLTVMFPGCSVGLEDDASSIGKAKMGQIAMAYCNTSLLMLPLTRAAAPWRD